MPTPSSADVDANAESDHHSCVNLDAAHEIAPPGE
jgi:hypothetical protein